MIKNNSLGDRLNEFKNNMQNTLEENNLISEETNSNDNYITPIKSLLNSLNSLFVISVKSLIIGYGVNTLMNLDWKILGCLGVGMTITFMLEFILDLVAIIKN
jgi:hypothetical protein